MKLVAGNAWVMKSNIFVTQDVDAAFMGKSDLQSKVDTLYGEVNFLKYLFDTVSSFLRRSPFLFPLPIRAGEGSSHQESSSSCWGSHSLNLKVGAVGMQVGSITPVGEGEEVSCFMVSGHLGHEGSNQVFTLCEKSIGLRENPVENDRRDSAERQAGGEQESVPQVRL